MQNMNRLGRALSAVAFFALCLIITGCSSGPKFDYDPLNPGADPAAPQAGSPTDPGNGPDWGNVLHVGESIIINFADTPTPVTPIETLVKEDGTVTLIYNQKFVAAGKTVGLLQNEIRDRYVPQYYKFLTVTIKTEERFFSIGGQVRAPNRVQYATKITLLQAINTAGGFTDFADKKRVQVTRANRKVIKVNCVKAIDHPELDVEIFPGDSIYVPKKIW
jgi:polysaccharide export outer membrane protein